MARSHPERYKPGELGQTRSNLGELSKEEADRMVKLLGGEIGIEQTDEELKKKYERLKKSSETTIHKGGASIGTKRGPLPEQASVSGSSAAFSGHYHQKKQISKKINYFDRIKIDRIASKPEHRVKTRAAVVSTYFSFLVKNRDTVNPDFLTDGDSFYYRHIENLVSSLKSLLKQVKPSTFKLYLNPYYRDIIKILISWNLKELSGTLLFLQKSPRNRDVIECSGLCRLIYSPIIAMGDTELKYIYAAVDRLYRVLIVVHAEDPDELISIKNRYLDIKEEIRIVFKDVAYTCYPLLLKLTASRFFYYREFMKKNRMMIINFLNIESDSILTEPEYIHELSKKQYSIEHLKKKIEKEKEELLNRLKPEQRLREETEISNCPDLLEQLFPESEWKQFRDFPDFFPYFHPLFKFPKGSELIAPEDPLQQIVVLAAILQDLLYGFRSIKIFSKYREPIENIVDHWHLFIDDMIQKNYTKLLVEYCRNIEKGTDLVAGKFSQKLLTDMYWFKRKFILPYMKFKVLYKSESVPVKMPKFNDQVSRFYKALTNLMEEFDKSENPKSIIENFNMPFHFEIRNITSFRLRKVLNKENIATTNENLIRYTMMIVSMLDFLLNSPKSSYYIRQTEDIPVYRYDPVFQGKPLYSVPLLDTEAILKKY